MDFSEIGSLRFFVFVALLAMFSETLLHGQVSVLTNRYDNGRDAANTSEPFLNGVNVNAARFAKLGAYDVDGYVVAQPLYMPSLSIGGTLHNVVFIATQHDSVYAFDADNVSGGAPLWQTSFINPGAGITTVPISEQGCGTVNGYTEMGIQGTPVIDPVTGTLYVDVKTKEVVNSVTSYVHRLHALDITNGQDKLGPVAITGSVQSQHGAVIFDSLKSCQRPGLLLSKGTVYIAYGSNGCDTNHGWVFAYDAATLTQMGVFNTSPNQTRGSAVWQAGAGLAADPDGNVFFLTANGAFNVNTGGADIGDSFVKLTLGATLTRSDYFTPFDQANMNTNDLDLGAGGIMLVTGLGGQYSSVAIGAGKTGTVYVVDPTNMGGYNSTDNSQIIQWMQSAITEVNGTPAFWNNNVYFAPDHAPVVGFMLDINGRLGSIPFAQSQPQNPVGGPIVSSNGPNNGIVWLIRSAGSTAKQLSAFDATRLNEIYNSTQVPSRDTLGTTAHFVIPTVANGKVFVGTQTQLVIYGLMPVISPQSGGNQTGTAGSTLPTPLTVLVTDPYTGTPLPGVTVTFSGKGTFGSPTAVTDSTGTATTSYTLPKTFTVPTVTLTASSPGYASATFVETVTAGSPASIAYLSGGSQTGTVGTTLPLPIVFKVLDQYGNGVPGVAVSLSDSPNHGIFSNNPVTTDSTGRASFIYTLPTKAGFITVTAAVGSLTKSVQERAVAASPASLIIVSGNNQTVKKNTLLPKQLMVKVTDQYGNAVAGITVTYDDNGASGTFSSTTAITNASGQAAVSYTTPQQPKTVSITATVTGLTPVTFTVNVTT